ncbi:MAG: hypothetical protein Q8O66_03180 [bacterium]|nr:hypothetical protein [bacterium]
MDEHNNMTGQPVIKKKISFKLWVHIISLLILIIFAIYGYNLKQQTNALRIETQAVTERAQKFDILNNSIKAEQDRCEKFITQKEGDFGSFEYCKEFIDWVYALPIPE